MRQKTEPVFFVRLEPKAPPATTASLANSNVAAIQKTISDLQKQLDQQAAASKASAGPGLPANPAFGAIIAKLANQIADEKARLVGAQAAAKDAPAPPPPPPPDPGDDLGPRVLSFEYADDEKKTDLCKITLNNQDLALFDHPVFDKGTILHVSWGYPGNMTPTRKVVVQKVKGALTLSVEAQDKGILMHKDDRARSFENVTRAEVAHTIATEEGYEAEAVFIDDTVVKYSVITQAAETNAQFLKRLADKEGFEFYVDHDGFHWHARRLDQKPARVLQWYMLPDVGDIISFDVDTDVGGKKGSASVAGRDPLAKADIKATADASTTPRTTLAPTPEVPAPTTKVPISVLDKTTGELTTVYKDAPAKNGAAAASAQPTTATTQAEAKRGADATFRRSQQNTVTLTLSLIGDPGIAAKQVVEVRGIGKRMSGKYYLTEVKHVISSSGYTISAKGKTDGTHGSGAGTGTGIAKPNKKDADPPPPAGQPGTLTPISKLDKTTGELVTVYKDSSGKEIGDDGKPKK